MIYLELIWTFIKIGAFTFGGGYAMIPLIQSEVTARGWMSTEEILNFIAVSESTPGPFAINMATYIGTETAGFWGAVCATFAVVLPSFVIILIIARIYSVFQTNRYVAGCMSGIKPVVIGLIASALYMTAKAVFFPQGLNIGMFADTATWFSLVILALDVFLAVKKIHPITIIAVSAVLGIAFGYADKLLI
ncbi:MAG: chromate transporter [Eubacteriales bacterium]